MIELKDFLLVGISGIAGLIFGQASGYFDRRAEKKQALSRALSELLEIRHRFKSSIFLITFLGNETRIPSSQLDEAIAQFPDGVLWEDSLSVRYNEAVSILSSHAPILAYYLRSKDAVRIYCIGPQLKFGETDETRQLTLKNIALVEKALEPAIEETITSIAKLVSKKHHKLTLEIIEASRVPDELVVATTREAIHNVIATIQSSGAKASS